MEIKNIEELIDYPNKKDYVYIVDKDRAPNCYLFFVKYYLQETDSVQKYETFSLECMLDILEDTQKCAFKEGDYDELSEREKDILQVETLEDLNDLINKIEDELCKLKLGSMTYDW